MKLTEDILQRYFDGELSRQEAVEVRIALEQDEQAYVRLAALGEVGQAIRDCSSEAASEASFTSMWDNIAREIKPARLSRMDRLRLALRRWNPFKWLLFAAPAAAAAVLAVLLVGPMTAPPANDCVIENLETGPDVVSTIFTIEADDDDAAVGATTVIWVSDQS